jgi:hypothetical protein
MLSQEDRVPGLRAFTEGGRRYHRDWVARMFKPQLAGLRGAARERRLTALVVATDLYTWKLLRQDLRLERKEAERIVCEMIGPPTRRRRAPATKPASPG